MDFAMVYDIIYALAARDGREAALFGNYAPIAREAFARSLTGTTFPEIWFEIPLVGDPWLDFHALVSHADVAGTQAAFAEQAGAYADALTWFASQPPKKVRQLALSYDTHTGDVDNPAVQLLVADRDETVPLEFLEAVGRSDAKDAYRTFVHRMPSEWYACYVGTFPGREAAGTSPWVRVECIAGDKLQRAYADDSATLREHLERIGLGGVHEEAIAGIHELAQSPFPLELQFNVGSDGTALPVISASVRFQPIDWKDDGRKAEIERLMRQIQNQGLSDDRWKHLEKTCFAKNVKRGEETTMLACFPAFVKLRWRADEPACAKVYLIACTQ